MGIFNKTRVTPEQFKAKMEMRRKARIVPPSERRPIAVVGLRKYAARFAAVGDTATAEQLAEYANKAEALLQAEGEAQTELAAARSDWLGEAVKAASVELRKKLPACFPTDEDAAAFCRDLPLIEARAAVIRDTDKAFKIGKRIHAARRDFGELMERAAPLATGETDGNKAMNTLVACGR